jgi:hypothetical protein
MAFQVFLIAWLLANHHELRMYRPFAEYSLRRVPVERAAPAMRRVIGDLSKP